MPAALTLECFDRIRPPAPMPQFGPEDVREAFDRGLQQGRAGARDELAERLCRELAALQTALAERTAAEAAQRASALAALRPLLEALFDGVLPAAAQMRLQAGLLGELDRLARTAVPLRGHVRCGPDLAPFVAACLERTGNGALDLDGAQAAGTVDLSVAGGAILFDRQAVTASLRALADEFLEEA